MVTLTLCMACNDPPQVAYSTERFDVAPDFDHPICRGTLDALDAQADRVQDELRVPPFRGRFLLYWLADVSEYCTQSESGCFYPGTRVLFATESSIRHEIVHAVLDAPNDDHVFLEEGLAELFEGNDTVHDPRSDGQDLATKLALDRSDARRGDLSYPAAAHFLNWATRQAGSVPPRVATDLDHAADRSRVRATIESLLDASLEEIDARYRDEAGTLLRGSRRRSVKRLSLDDLADGYRVELDCDDAETYGPRPHAQPGMYRVFRLWLPGPTSVQFELEPEPDAVAWVDVFDPDAAVRDLRTVDWSNPDPSIDRDALRLRPHTPTRRFLHGGTWVLSFNSATTRPIAMTLHARAAIPPVP